MGRSTNNIDETDIAERLHRLEEQVLSSRTPDNVALKQNLEDDAGDPIFDAEAGHIPVAKIDPEAISSFNYVGETEPTDPSEGESFYDTSADAAYVYTDGAGTKQKINIVSHGELSDVNPGAHRTDANIRDTAIPSGVITMWSGTTSDVPSGWTLCDGTDGTPDLQDRFVVGAGGQYAADATGGSESVTLTESEMPSHAHGDGSLSTSTDGSHSHDAGVDSSATGAMNILSAGWEQESTLGNAVSTSGSHNHSVSGTTGTSGSDSSHENRPPYYALAFIMKV